MEGGQVEEVSRTSMGRASDSRLQATIALIVSVLLEAELEKELRQPLNFGIILGLNWKLEKELMEQSSTLSLVELVVGGIDPSSGILVGVTRIEAVDETIKEITTNALLSVFMVDIQLESNGSTRTALPARSETVVEALRETEPNDRFNGWHDDLPCWATLGIDGSWLTTLDSNEEWKIICLCLLDEPLAVIDTDVHLVFWDDGVGYVPVVDGNNIGSVLLLSRAHIHVDSWTEWVVLWLLVGNLAEALVAGLDSSLLLTLLLLKGNQVVVGLDLSSLPESLQLLVWGILCGIYQ